MQKFIGTSIGKILQAGIRLSNSNGQALPGLVVEKLFPRYFAAMLEQLPEGVIVITGTNGKTTTTKMVVELLRAGGKRVITNPTGSNLTRGIISSLVQQAGRSGHLPFDMAVFEIDEAYAKQFVAQVKPRWTLALNISRDQLDRFGEVDAVAALIAISMRAASEGIVTNANDPRLSEIGKALAKENKVALEFFGVDSSLQKFFPSDNELVSIDPGDKANLPKPRPHRPSVELMAFEEQSATYQIANKKYTTSLQVTGQHNFQNAAAALALVRQLLPQEDDAFLVKRLSQVGIAFGRGQIFKLRNGSDLQLVLVKNPASFRQTLASYVHNDAALMIAINDNYADSRDVSWLWDVDFTSLADRRIAFTSGSRAADMALRLQYDAIDVENIEPNIDHALREFCRLAQTHKVIIATYTAMLYLHATLEKNAGTSL